MAPVSFAPDGYRDLRDHLAWGDAGRRRIVLVAGEDAVRFVDGFCTASLATLVPGAVTEAFFPDARGQVLLWATILRMADGVWIDADPPLDGDGEGWSLAMHLDRYHIRERLEIIDASDRFATLFLAGPAAGAWLQRQASPPAGSVEDVPGREASTVAPMVPHHGRLADVAAGILPGHCAGIPAAILPGEWLGPGSFLVVVPRTDATRLVDRWRREGIVEASFAALEAVRREEGRPSPCDVPPRVLPQELGRDVAAISFTKGCYLGQETVARLDALGHVNRRFVGIVTAADVPAGPAAGPGATVTIRGAQEAVGTITSAGLSPRLGEWLGLGLMRRQALAAGVELEVAGLPARWVQLPLSRGTSGGVA
jgi:folate-binding protein YgfZ